MRLNLLFTKNGLQYQLAKNKNVAEEKAFFFADGSAAAEVEERLHEILRRDFSEIRIVSALNHFTVMPEGFADHESGHDLIALNASVDAAQEELMLSVNHKFGVQFYYTLPKSFYTAIKSVGKNTNFNFSGEQFLNSLQTKGNREIHINLYHNQCEFFALENRKVLLYNNLDMDSEVDFLYFIMFTLSKIGFGTASTWFYVYGETTENETFISELQKFVKHLKIVYDNIPGKNFVLA